MADIRINSLSTTASSTASNDFLAIDGATNGTRKLSAYNPTFGGSVTINGNGTYGALQLPSGTTTVYGIALGTDTNIWRTDAGSVDVGGASAATISLNVGGSNKGYFYNNGTDTTLSGAGTLTLKSNGTTTGLTLDSSNATVAGALTVNSTTESGDKDTGSIVAQGGLGVEKNANIGGNATVGGTLAVSGVLSTDAGYQLFGSDNTSYELLRYAGGSNNPGLFVKVNESTKKVTLLASGSLVSGQVLALGAEGSEALTIGAANATLAGNLTAADLILGTSGPSVKSTLSARAPRQGLVFDGTAGATVSVPAFGTGNFTLGAWVRFDRATGTLEPIISGGGDAPTFYRAASGELVLTKVNVGGGASTSALTWGTGKTYFIAVSSTAQTYQFYVDGVAVATGSSVACNFTAAIAYVGGDGSNYLSGLVQPLIYNRALSAAEVVSLYEAGAPSAADYSAIPASNTNQAATLTADIGSPTIAGNQVTFSGASTQRVRSAQFSYRLGNKIAVTAVVTGFSGSQLRCYLAGGAAQSITANGTYTFVQSDGTTGTNAIYFDNNNNTAGTVTLTVTAQGLLLAPDSAQAGGGLVWYDTSGNAANITLPASGVSWNVPSSRVLGGNWTTSGNLTVSGGTGTLGASGGGDALLALKRASDGLTVGNLTVNTASSRLDFGTAYTYLTFSTESTERARFVGGNLILGTTTDGGPRLQTKTKDNTYAGAGFSILDQNAGTTFLTRASGTFYISNNGSTDHFILDGSGNATFAGKITVGTDVSFPAGGYGLLFGSTRIVEVVSDGINVVGSRIRISTDSTPASASASGTKGDIKWDADYIYVCTATNTWKRVAIATW